MRFVVLKRARDMKIINKKNTQSRAHFHHQKRDFDGQRSVWSVWSEISTGIGANSSGREEILTGIGADSSGREEISHPPLVDSYTLSSFYNKITIFPLIVMYFSSRFLSVFGYLIYIIVSCFQTYYINSIFPLNKYQLYSYKFLRASIS